MKLATVMKKLFFSCCVVVVICGVLSLFPLATLTNNEKTDNPAACIYYITLQSLLTSYPLLASDAANAQLIKNKLLKFERNIAHATNQAGLAYKNTYYAALATANVTSIATVTDAASILQLARVTGPTIDQFYLDKNFYCLHPLYAWHGAPAARRILRYNLAGLYDQLPRPYTSILSAVADDWLTGSNAGLYLINQTTTVDARFMTGYPLLTALYMLPKYDFVAIGRYASPATWNYFRADSFIDPLTRKVLDIAGVDVFTVAPDDLGEKEIPAVRPLLTTIAPVFERYVSFVNYRSYGIAYLANHIQRVWPANVAHMERVIKHYFKHHDDTPAFTRATQALYQQLQALPEPHDVILETKQMATLDRKFDDFDNPAGSVEIKGMIGGRNLFISHCASDRDHCLFVLNLADAPGWLAYVNGQQTTIARVNFAFMGVMVPTGVSKIWIIYSPWTTALAYFSSALCLLSILVLSCRRMC